MQPLLISASKMASPKERRVFHILIVDDDAPLCRTLRLALGSEGYDVRSVPDGVTALDTIAATPPDLVVLDWNIPALDGIQVCSNLRAKSDVPIIMVSAHHTISRKAAVDAGANEFLHKPFSIGELLTRINSLLRP